MGFHQRESVHWQLIIEFRINRHRTRDIPGSPFPLLGKRDTHRLRLVATAFTHVVVDMA